MFKRKTVFIVGAGGSYELGLPVGDQLARTIASKLNIVPNSNRTGLSSGDAVLAGTIDFMARRAGQDPFRWYATGVEIAKSMPLAISIDNFLHTHSQDETAIILGKLAITASILDAERSSDIFCQPHERVDFLELQQSLDAAKREPSWHNAFFRMLTENVKLDALDEIFQNISIITFNYDRCIEHYLAFAFAQYMRMDIATARELCSKLEITHPYGQVGDLNRTVFGADPTTDYLAQISSGIRTFTEQVHEQETVARMHQRLIEAEIVVALGFSYGDMNLELMDIVSEVGEKTIIGTALGISEFNRRKIDVLLRDKLKLQGEPWLPIYLVDDTCAHVLRDHWRVILN